MLSYRCSAACRHCMYACSPEYPADWLAEDELKALLGQLAGHIRPSPHGRGAVSLNHGLHFTGGEPFLNFELLLRATGLAHDAGIPSTFVETNAFWCSSDDVARERLTALRQAGLRGIMVSVNPFFAEFVPFERTERCVRASLDVFGDNAFVYQRAYWQLFRKMGLRGTLPLEEYVERTHNGEFAHHAEMVVMGRATWALRQSYRSFPAERFFDASCMPPVLRSWHNHYDNYGSFMAGYCGGVSLGDWHDLDTLLAEGIDSEARPVLALLVSDDLPGLLEFAQEHGYRERPDGYISKCDLCLDLRRHLVTEGDFPELAPKAFYAHGLGVRFDA
jgi:hypothetical protein